MIHDLGRVTLYEGDVRASLDLMPEQSVHTVVTSPPYWALLGATIPLFVEATDG